MSNQSLRAALARMERRPLGPTPPDDEDVVAAVDRNLVEAMSRWDRGARASRRLAVRVSGESVTPGRLDSAVSEELLHALRREVTAAAPTGTLETLLRLELTGVGIGSAVLYLEPQEDSHEQSADELVQTPDPLDDALRTVLDLHATAEAENDLGRFARSKDLLRAFDSLTTALDEHDLSLGTRWRARTGTVAEADLTRTGRDYARPYLERLQESDEVTLTGRVTVLDIDGGFTLRASAAKNAPRYEVRLPAGLALTDLGLTLGTTVSVRVERTVSRARLGLESKPKYVFVTMNSTEDQLP